MLALFILIVGPPFIIEVFQKTLASGIYAVSYDKEASSCEFIMMNEEVLRGECKLPLINHSKKDIEFTIEFYDYYKGLWPEHSLMNNNGVHEVTLKGKETKVIDIVTEIPVSELDQFISGGSSNYVNIIFKSDQSSREL